MTQEIVLTRPLGLCEHFLRSRTVSGFYVNFAVTGTYSLDLKEDLSIVFKSLRKTILDYHILICNVFKDTDLNDCILKPIELAKFSDIVVIEDSDVFLDGEDTINEKFMKRVNEEKFDLYKNSPLFRLFIIGRHNLCAVFEHTIADGVAGALFHELFLENLAFVMQFSNKEILEIDYGISEADCNIEFASLFNYEADFKFLRHSLPPPIDIFMADPKLRYGEANYFDKIIPDSHPDKWEGFHPAELNYSIAFKLVNLTPSDLKSVLSKCKDMKVSLTAYFCVVAALTLQPLFGDKKHTSHRVAISLRRHLDLRGVPTESQNNSKCFKRKKLGSNAFVGLPENFPPFTDFSWDMVKQVNNHIKLVATNNKVFNTLHSFQINYDKLGENPSYFESTLGYPKQDATKISNLGFINFPIYQVVNNDLTIENLIFSQDMSPNTSEFMFNIVSTPIGGMNIVLSFHDDKIDSTGSMIFDNLVVQLKRAILQYCT
ncbi:uncharacterized protein PRCAT00002857001 [Priceomyces carsonii]|uniref:uncharacterized protein n=1 Tax=Priceomyces carsonii TaxID=28549 RepID=UPI002EDA195F|nr:unnamed protein product [Priceomyces carsonii]